VLEEHLRLRRIAKCGPGSEKLSNLQLQLLEEEPGVSNQEVQAESEREALPAPDGEKKRQRRAHPGRQTFPTDLPRVEKIIACTAEQCVCGKCCAETKVIGYDESEVLNVKPAEYYVGVFKREKRACKQCQEQGVAMAPLRPRIIDKSLVADELIDKLFLVDAQAREEKMDHAARHALRRQKALLLLDQIREHILAASKTVLPSSKAGQACNYTLTLWNKLTIFLQYP
jgi:Transposase IS66 family/zinc-finger binding domain of transposase IS66/Transposase C of IS166 homeodomain